MFFSFWADTWLKMTLETTSIMLWETFWWPPVFAPCKGESNSVIDPGKHNKQQKDFALLLWIMPSVFLWQHFVATASSLTVERVRVVCWSRNQNVFWHECFALWQSVWQPDYAALCCCCCYWCESSEVGWKDLGTSGCSLACQIGETLHKHRVPRNLS